MTASPPQPSAGPSSPRSRIRILPDAVADQIAAGEVVERPASAVKELVENALDAGARHVRIALEGGGKTLIEVSDDGHGMGREDAVLALDRHATSKIVSAADLVGVRTFGFRGEALPAIASVSRFTLVSAPREGGLASEITVTGGRIDRVGDATRQPGTTITVRGLFFNTPARRKFLRSVSSESRAAFESVTTLALSHPETGFELLLDGRVRLQVPPGQTLDERLAAVWGPELSGTLIPLSYAAGPFRLEGFIQRPADASPSGRRVQLFVNGRPFRDNFLVRAAEAGYRSAIHPGDRPSLYLRLETAADSVDVNVHPAKLEVRFRDRIGIERTVEEAVRHALGALVAAAPIGDFRPMPRLPDRPAGVPDHSAEAQGLESDLFGIVAPGKPGTGGDPLTEEGAESGGGAEFAAPVWQLFDTYLVFEGSDGMVIVDQHSAHERVLFQRVMEQLGGGTAAATSQRLLLPLTFDLTDEELDVIEHHRDVLHRVGFEVEGFGGRSVVVQAVPAPHPRFDASTCFQELVADLARGRFGGWNNQLERFAATYACRAAVKAGTPLADRERRELLLQLFAGPLPAHDVHGRATIVQLPREELERRFGRR